MLTRQLHGITDYLIVLWFSKESVGGGGIFSTDLYKVYGNGLLDRLVASLLGTWIGDICCVAPACADDLALSSDSPLTIQRLVNIGVDFSIGEIPSAAQ